MVRGVSGGQKKRVTTGEMIVGCATIASDTLYAFVAWSLASGTAVASAPCIAYVSAPCGFGNEWHLVIHDAVDAQAV